jgi:hypothetical protein
MKTQKYLPWILLFFIILSIGFISCSTVSRSAVSCPDIKIKKNDFRAFHKTQKTKKLIADSRNDRSKRVTRNIKRSGSSQIREINGTELYSAEANDRDEQKIKTEFGKIMVASADTRMRPPVAQVVTLPSLNKKYAVAATMQQGNCDTIILKSGAVIIGKVDEIGQNELKYRKCNYLSGPVISILRSDVSRIRYSNGTDELFGPTDTNYPVLNHNPTVNSIGPKTEGLGLAGFITALVGLFVASIPLGIIATVFGLVSLSKIKRNPQRYYGKGFALFSIIIGIMEVITMIIILS